MKSFARLLALTTMMVSVPALAQVTTNSSGVPVISTQSGQIYYRVPIPANDTSAPATAYSWVPTVSACSNQCGTGTTTTSYICENQSGSTVASSNCVAADGTAPSGSSASCTVYSGCTYTWVQPAPTQTVVDIPPYPMGTLTCGDVQSVYSPYCQRSDGLVLSSADDAFCQNSAGYPTSPSGFGGTTTAEVTTGCSAADFTWQTGAWSPYNDTCSATATQTRTVTCVRNFDGATVPDSNCPTATEPPASQTAAIYTSCTYAWVPGAWGAWSTSATPSTTTGNAVAAQSRNVPCVQTDPATGNQTTVANSFCTTPAAGVQPATVESASYATGAYGPYNDTCSAAAYETRTVTCTDNNGNTEPAAYCTSAGLTAPSTTSTPTGVYTSCTYSWTAGPWGSWSITVPTSGNTNPLATQTRSVTCTQTDPATGNTTTVPNADCSAAGPAPISSETLQYFTGSWAPTSACSTTTAQTRSVICEDENSNTQSDATCNAAGLAQPAASQVVPIYTSCTYSWVAGAYSAPSSTCSATATETETTAATCLRSDGTTVPTSNCTGPAPATTITVPTYSGCTWQTGSWTPSVACSTSQTSTRSVTCGDGVDPAVANSYCSGPAPASTEAVANYAGCSYHLGSWSAPSSNCSAAAVETRSVLCSDGTDPAVPDADCSGPTPAASQTVASYSSCSWQTSAWSGPSSTCSSTATETRSVTCGDGTDPAVSTAECSGPAPATSQTVPTYTGCSYSWQASGFANPSSTCSANATETQTVTCLRSDGTTVPNSSCSGPAPATSETVGVYTGCTYSWGTSYSGLNSTCSLAPTETYQPSCIRSDGTTVPTSSCNAATEPAATITEPANFSGCTFTRGTALGSCSGGSQTVTNTCTATNSGGTVVTTFTDNTDVQNYCGVPSSTTQSCVNTWHCTQKYTYETARGGSNEAVFYCTNADGSTLTGATFEVTTSVCNTAYSTSVCEVNGSFSYAGSDATDSVTPLICNVTVAQAEADHVTALSLAPSGSAGSYNCTSPKY